MKKLLGIFLAAVTVIAACVGFVGCNKGDAGQGTEEPPKTEDPAGTIYSLQAAYDNGFLTKEDLEQIAYYNNNFVKPEEELDPQIEQMIKETLAYNLSHEEEWDSEYYGGTVKADKFRISKYYGEHNGCYAFMEMNQYVSYPAVEVETTIDGVQFTYSDPSGIKVYKINN